MRARARASFAKAKARSWSVAGVIVAHARAGPRVDPDGERIADLGGLGPREEDLLHRVRIIRVRELAGLLVDRDGDDARRPRELARRLVLVRGLHELDPRREGGHPAGLRGAERLSVVVPDPRRGGDLRRV